MSQRSSASASETEWTVGKVAVDEAGALEFAEDRHDAAGAMHVFQMHVGNGGRDLAEHRHAARQAVDVAPW